MFQTKRVSVTTNELVVVVVVIGCGGWLTYGGGFAV